VTVLKTEDVVFTIGWPYVFVMWLSICEWEPQGRFLFCNSEHDFANAS